jgi:signal transduction histidine kinase/ActR/RegA family two-component response regulator
VSERRVLVHVAAHDALLAERVLQSAGIEAQVLAGEGDLAAELEAGVGALLLAEESLTEGAVASLGRYLARQPAWSDLPVLVMAKRGADSLEAQRAMEHLGNVTMLERPVRTITLVSAARSALRARDRQYEMRTLSRRKDEFLATLAHELRNPLAPIRNATAILERLHPNPKVASLVGMVDRQVSHLKRLVDDLLDVARITSGKLELQVAPTSARSVAAHAVEIAQESLVAKGHRVSVQQPEEDIALQADHVRLVQSVANLLVNAAKFTPPSGDIVLRVGRHDGQVEFAVRDSGRGLEPDELDRIFEMFEQSRGAGEPSGGLGLGLHLTRAFAQMHGGTVFARSAGRNQGSEFILRLPVLADAAAGSAGGPDLACDVPPLPRKVLVVDDNLDAASTLEALLSLHGIQVTVAHDGASACALVAEEGPDAVVMDIGMPVMNGYEAARRIRDSGQRPQPVLIALTGWGQYADKERAAQAGFDHHFVKPLQVDELLGCLSRLAAARPAEPVQA